MSIRLDPWVLFAICSFSFFYDGLSSRLSCFVCCAFYFIFPYSGLFLPYLYYFSFGLKVFVCCIFLRYHLMTPTIVVHKIDVTLIQH